MDGAEESFGLISPLSLCADVIATTEKTAVVPQKSAWGYGSSPPAYGRFVRWLSQARAASGPQGCSSTFSPLRLLCSC